MYEFVGVSVWQQGQVRTVQTVLAVLSWTLVAAQYLVRQWIHVRRQLGASCAVLARRMALVKGRRRPPPLGWKGWRGRREPDSQVTCHLN